MDRTLLHYEVVRETKADQWVVMVHGAGGSIKTWKYQIGALSSRYNLLMIDLRDHGRSKNIQPEVARYTFQHISEDIRSVLDHVGVAQAHFVTLSFGSVLMQDFASRFPDRVQKIVFAGGIFRGTRAIRLFVDLARLLNLLLPYEKMYGLFSWLLMPRPRNQKARRLYQMQARKLTQTEYMKWVGLYGEFFRLLRQFAKTPLLKESLIVMGSDDFVFLKGARAFTAIQPFASMTVIPKSGHICNIETPEAFNRLTLDFLAAASKSTKKSLSTSPSESN